MGHLAILHTGHLATLYTGHLATLYTGHLAILYTGQLAILYTGHLAILYTGHLATQFTHSIIDNLNWLSRHIHNLVKVTVEWICLKLDVQQVVTLVSAGVKRRH